MNSIIRAAAIQAALKPRGHPMDASRIRNTTSLGDTLGLTKLGVHKSTLESGMLSTVEHYHEVDDEWFFIVKGSGFLVGDGEEIAVNEGDFIGFPAGNKVPHAFRGGEKGMEYLTGGSRERIDMTHYPLIGKGLILNRAAGTSTVVDERDEQQP